MDGLQALALQKARERNLDPNFVSRLINQESRWNPAAVSPAGARGLMQIMPATGRDLGLTSIADLLNPEKNIDAGTRYLSQLSDRYNGDQYKIAAAYNAGMGRVPVNQPIESFFSRLPAETRNYVQKIVGPVETGGSSDSPAVFGPPTRRPSTPELRQAQSPSLFEFIYNHLFGDENDGLPRAKTWPGPEVGLPPAPEMTTGDLAMMGALSLGGMGAALPAIGRGVPALMALDPLRTAVGYMTSTGGEKIGGEIGEHLYGREGKNMGEAIGGLIGGMGKPELGLKKEIVAIPPTGPLEGTAVLTREGLAKPMYHGTPRAFDEFDVKTADKRGLFGPGLYHTSAAENVATGYSRIVPVRRLEQEIEGLNRKIRKQKAQSIGASEEMMRRLSPEQQAELKNVQPGTEFDYAISMAHEQGKGPLWDAFTRWESKQKRLEHLEQKVEGLLDKRHENSGFASASNIRPAYLNIKKPFDIDANPTGDTFGRIADSLEKHSLAKSDEGIRDLIDELRSANKSLGPDGVAYSRTAEMIYDRLTEILGDKAQVNKVLQQAGFDGITHLGGGRFTGGPHKPMRHRVYIAFKNDQVIPAFDPRVTQAQVSAKEDALRRKNERLKRLNDLLDGRTITTEAAPRDFMNR